MWAPRQLSSNSGAIQALTAYIHTEVIYHTTGLVLGVRTARKFWRQDTLTGRRCRTSRPSRGPTTARQNHSREVGLERAYCSDP